jgi:endonuclease/exonuclease/phosphatase family metal-dependent hydrolase
MIFKILTFNCQKGHNAGFADYISKVVKSGEYDFILLQEANFKVTNTINNIKGISQYRCLTEKSDNTGTNLEILILYKKQYVLEEKFLIGYSSVGFYERTEKASLAGVFTLPKEKAKQAGKEKILICSTHLHAGHHAIIRKRELKHTKAELHKIDPNHDCIRIIGGDFNNLIKGEWSMHDRIMRPQYVNATMCKEYTCDSFYIESHFIPPTVQKFITYTRFRWRTIIDHIYIDSYAYKNFFFQSQVVDVIASDHKPVELIVSKNDDIT